MLKQNIHMPVYEWHQGSAFPLNGHLLHFCPPDGGQWGTPLRCGILGTERLFEQCYCPHGTATSYIGHADQVMTNVTLPMTGRLGTTGYLKQNFLKTVYWCHRRIPNAL